MTERRKAMTVPASPVLLGRPTVAGFTLIELSVVLVIIGLIVDGVLVGQDLIHAAQVRAQITQFERFRTAVNTFLTKYAALPGDMPNATAFWPADPSCNTYGVRTSMTTPNGMTCNGNGNGIVEAHGSNYSAESSLFWQHLNLAGLIQDGPFTGSNDGGGSSATNAPTYALHPGTGVMTLLNPDTAYPQASYPNWFGWLHGGP